MEDNDVLSYDEYNVAIFVFYIWFFIVTGLMIFFDYEILIHIKTISNFWIVPISWGFSSIPSIVCLACLNSFYYERNKFYSTEFIVKRKDICNEKDF